MNWSTQAIRHAAQHGDYGRVIRLARLDAGMSQKQLGEACGVSQSAISRTEGHGVGSYDMKLLAKVVASLRIPSRLVGLADHVAPSAAHRDGSKVERRDFLSAGAAIATAPALSALSPAPRAAADGQITSLRLATTAFRHLDASTPSRYLIEPVTAHLRLARTMAGEASTSDQRVRLAASSSEVASLAGWLSWDMGDHGSARAWYGTAVTAARRSSDRLLIAYQLGSLAQLEAHAANAAQSLSLTRSARRQLGRHRPAIAEAWLSTVEALAHAVAGDAAAADRALTHAARGVERLSTAEAPPWPWVFVFNDAKVAACRLSCGARLGLPRWVEDSQERARATLSSGHDKQGALLMLDIAAGHLAAGRLDGAFSLATRALETGLRHRSGRIVERARTLRRSYTTRTPAKVVRDFDDRLHDVYL